MFNLRRRPMKKKMEDALNEIQAFIRASDEGNTMSIYQHKLIPDTKTFIQYASEAEGLGQSEYGALMRYCLNAINVVQGGVDSGNVQAPIICHIGEKMAHVAMACARCVPDDKLTSPDWDVIKQAEAVAKTWLVHPKRESIVDKIDNIVHDMVLKAKNDGVINTLKQGSGALQPLMSWPSPA